jgi:elongation factor P
MDIESFEQISLPSDIVGEPVIFLQDGMEVTVESHEGTVIGIELPETAVQVVTETEPVVKGQTAAASYKPALLDNGVRTMVPAHIHEGDRVVLNTGDGSYVERARD